MLKLLFDFQIDNKPVILNYKTSMERIANIVSFSLEYKMNIEIANAKLISIQKQEKSYVYVFEFEDINDAIMFEDERQCRVLNSTNFNDPNEVEKEIIRYAETYTSKQTKKRKKTLVEREDGFMKYI